MSAAAKGQRYKLKTKKYFEEKGYHVEYMERLQVIPVKGRTIYVKKDILGADGCAVSDTEFILWNSVLGRSNIAAHRDSYRRYPSGGVKRVIVVWEQRKKEPEIVEV